MNDRYMVISPDTLEAMRRAGHAAKLEARIEKLEAALQRANATAEEYERKFYLGTDRIEKLEMLLQGEKCLRQDLKDTAEAHSKQQRDRIEKLETALREIVAWPTTVKAKMVKIARKALEGKDD